MIKKFYFPLTVHVMERGACDWSGEYADHDGTYAMMYAGHIMDTIHNYCDEDMIEYFRDDEPVRTKLQSMIWTSEIVNDCLYGRVDVEISEALTDEETEAVKDYICGQNSDGLGEGFEQHEIRVSYDEEIYVSFWHRGDDYWILDEDEFNAKVGRNTESKTNTEDKIIHIREYKNKGHLCLICCQNEGKFHFGMRRPKHGDSVISFRVCNSCLDRMRNDIQETCE
jgi:hypothetical protein